MIPGLGNPLEKQTAIQVFLPGESHGQRSLGTTVHEDAKSQTYLSMRTHMHWIIHYDRGTLVMEDVNRGIWELSVLPSQFFCKPKTPPNIKSLF